MRSRWRPAMLGVGLAMLVLGCELIPELATAPPAEAGEPAACLTLNEVLLTRQTVISAVNHALAGRETEALLAASRARAELAALVGDLHGEDGPNDLRAFVEEVARVVEREADIVDLGRVRVVARERLIGEGRTTLEGLDSSLRLALGEGSLAARSCPREPFFIPPFEFPPG